MKVLIVMILACLLTACAYEKPVYMSEGSINRAYDKDGNYAGHINKSGRVYDKDGNYVGKID